MLVSCVEKHSLTSNLPQLAPKKKFIEKVEGIFLEWYILKKIWVTLLAYLLAGKNDNGFPQVYNYCLTGMNSF